MKYITIYVIYVSYDGCVCEVKKLRRALRLLSTVQFSVTMRSSSSGQKQTKCMLTARLLLCTGR